MLKSSTPLRITAILLLAIALFAIPAAGQSFELRRSETQAATFSWEQLNWGRPSLVVGDFDGSGSQDLATVTNECAVLRVLMNPLSSAPTATAINTGRFCGGFYDANLFDPGDVDGDGYDDLFLVISDIGSSNDLYLLRGSPSGLQMPGAPILIETSGGLTEIVVTDMDGDGRKDLHVYFYDWLFYLNPQGNAPGDYVTRYRQTPSGQFLREWGTSFNLMQKALSGDVHGDGRDDVIGLRADVDSGLIGGHTPYYFIAVYQELQMTFMDASGVYRNAVFPHQLGTTNCLLRQGDWNSDGRTDVMVLSRSSPLVQVFLGDPTQGLIAQSPMALPAGLPNSEDLHIGDFDADGRTDLVVRANLTAGPALFRGESAGQLSAGSFALPSLATPLHGEVMEDLDGDGDADWAVLQLQSAAPSSLTFQVFENRARFGQVCGGAQGTPEIALGVASAGNPQFTISLQNAAPGALEQLFIATAARTIDDNLCGARFDLNALLIPSPSAWFTTSTDATGAAQQSFALPLGLAGEFILQWAIVDPLGSFQANNGIRIAATAARTIAIF